VKYKNKENDYNILYVYRTARSKILKGVKNASEPDHILYGFQYLSNFGYKVSFSDIAYGKLNILFWLLLPLQNWLIKKSGVGFKLDQAILLLNKAWRSDLIITTTDSAGLPFLLLKKIGLLNKPIIYISIGLANEMDLRKKSFICKFYLDLLKQANFIICHSWIEKKIFDKMSNKLVSKTKFIPFGIDIDFFKKKKKRESYVLSIGQDKSRDYKLLSFLTKRMNDKNFVIITQKTNIEGLDFGDNVELKINLPYGKVKDYYLGAELVIIPLKELNRASGQISFLESIASGNKTVIANTRGIKDVYPALFEGNEGVYTYKNGNIKSLEKVVSAALKDNKKVSKLANQYSSLEYGKNVVRLVRSI